MELRDAWRKYWLRGEAASGAGRWSRSSSQEAAFGQRDFLKADGYSLASDPERNFAQRRINGNHLHLTLAFALAKDEGLVALGPLSRLRLGPRHHGEFF